MTKIGIVGLGFVGEAILNAYETLFTDVVVVDIDPKKSTGTYADLQDCDAVFVCVPSPSKDTGECDTSILNSVLYMLQDYKNVIISKTTAPPQFYEKIQTVYPNLVHIPEFLTAAKANQDYLKEQNAIIGGKIAAYRNEAERIIKNQYADCSKIYFSKDIYDATLESDAILLVTEWKEFRMPTWQVVRKSMKGNLILDGRNIYDKAELIEFGFIYEGIG